MRLRQHPLGHLFLTHGVCPQILLVPSCRAILQCFHPPWTSPSDLHAFIHVDGSFWSPCKTCCSLWLLPLPWMFRCYHAASFVVQKTLCTWQGKVFRCAQHRRKCDGLFFCWNQSGKLMLTHNTSPLWLRARLFSVARAILMRKK